MVNAIPFGTYKKIIVLLSSIFITLQVLAQHDYVVLSNNTKEEISINTWHANSFEVAQGRNYTADNIYEVYRSQAGVAYKPLTQIWDKKPKSMPDLLLPSVESLKTIKTDYFTDENLEVWIQNNYFIYRIKNSVITNANQELENYNQNPIFLYHDSVGFTQIYGSEIEEEFYKLMLSKYFKDYKLREYIYDASNKVVSKDFLKFFDEMISSRTKINYRDEDLKRYYAKQLRNGALIVLLNTESKQAKMYADSGNKKLANKINERLQKENAQILAEFSDKNLYNFSSVYFTEASNREAILEGKKKNLFLNANLELDSSIILQEDFVLFTRKGTVYETRLLDNNILTKRIPSSSPMMQDVMVLYDCNNTQYVDPYIIMQRKKTASTFNNYFYKLFRKARDEKHGKSIDYQWEMDYFWFNNRWLPLGKYKPCTIIE